MKGDIALVGIDTKNTLLDGFQELRVAVQGRQSGSDLLGNVSKDLFLIHQGRATLKGLDDHDLAQVGILSHNELDLLLVVLKVLELLDYLLNEAFN